jgi:hypothetical protein
VPRELRTSLTQLEAWCIALRDAKLSLTIRHVNCDALAFCHVLRHQRVNNTHLTSHWYRRCQKFGRLGVKGSIALMHTHIFGFQGQEKTSLFSFYTASGQIARIFVNVVRFDVSNQTVFRDAAIIPSYPKISTEVDWIVLSTMRGQKIVTLVVDDMEIPFWHHLLPTFVERCRSWTHKSTCEYKAKGRNIPLSTKLNEQIMCTYLRHGHLSRQLSQEPPAAQGSSQGHCASSNSGHLRISNQSRNAGPCSQKLCEIEVFKACRPS